MIISHKYRFVYIKTRKTASTSIELALSVLLESSRNDIATQLVKSDELLRAKLKLPGAMNFKREDSKDLQFWKPHTNLQTLFESNLYNEIKDYLFISSIRNPYDRQVSAYFWDYRNILRPKLRDVAKSRFIKQVFGHSRAIALNQDLSFENYINTKCSTIMKDVSINDVQSINFWLKYESLENDLSRLSNFLEVDVDLGLIIKDIRTKDVYREKSKSPWEAFYIDNPETKNRVESVCNQEFITGHYEFI